MGSNKKARSPFEFKQFSLTDDGCSMKIGTDGVLLGAWAARFALETGRKKVLDIGTGCGIIALMIAQKTASVIHAIETEKSAVITARRNIEASPWQKKITLFHCPLQNFLSSEEHSYDLMVCNPPFFNSSYLSENTGRSHARHDVTLGFNDLFFHSARLLTPEGCLLVIYPTDNSPFIERALLKARLYEYRKIYIYPTPEAKPIRIIREVGRQPIATKPEKKYIIIESGKRHQFSEEYIALTREYHPFMDS